jgi:hypothetical protein
MITTITTMGMALPMAIRTKLDTAMMHRLMMDRIAAPAGIIPITDCTFMPLRHSWARRMWTLL